MNDTPERLTNRLEQLADSAHAHRDIDSVMAGTPSTHAAVTEDRSSGRVLTQVAAASIVVAGVGAIVAFGAIQDPPAAQAPTDGDGGAGTEQGTDPSAGVVEPTGEEAAALDAWNSFFSLMPYGESGNAIETGIIQQQRQECMNGRGFDYQQYPHVANLYDGPPPMMLPSPPIDEVSVNGYGAYLLINPLDTDPAANAAWEEAEQFNQHQSQTVPGWQDALMRGSDTNRSCIGEAEAFLDTQAHREARGLWRALTEDGTPPTRPAGFHGEEIDASRAAWSNCMTAAGYAYNDPSEPQDEFQTDRAGDEVTAEEIAIAVADTECRSSTGYREALIGAIGPTFQQWLTQHDDAVVELREAITDDIANMSRIADQLGTG